MAMMHAADHHTLIPAHTACRYQYEGSRGMATLKERKYHWREILCVHHVAL